MPTPRRLLCLQFQALGGSQREAIMRALNDDAQKLIDEYPPTAPEVRRLQAEMADCNELYASLMTRMEREPSGANQELVAFLEKLKQQLTELERALTSRMQENLPSTLRDVDEHLSRHRVHNVASIALRIHVHVNIILSCNF